MNNIRVCSLCGRIYVYDEFENNGYEDVCNCCKPISETEMGMNKTIQRPLACRNAHCGAMCSPADASFFGGNPSICLNYERRDDLYRDDKLLNKVKKAREKEVEE